MLRAEPTGFFSRDFTVYADGRKVADLDLAWLSESADVVIAGETCKVYREGLLGGAFIFEVRGVVVARAEKPSAFFRRFVVQFEGRQFELRALSFFGRSFGLFEGCGRIGEIRPESWLTRRAAIDLPGDVPIPVQVFMFWLVLILWNRAARTSSTPATT